MWQKSISDLDEIAFKVAQRRCHFAGLLGQVIVAAQTNRLAGIGLLYEGFSLRLDKGAPLQLQTVLGSGRQIGPINWVDQAQVTLGVYMHADGLKHRIGEQGTQKRQGHELMQIVFAGVHFLLPFLTGPLRNIPTAERIALVSAAQERFDALPPCRFTHLSVFAEPHAGDNFVWIDNVALRT